ncbi:hypothetical protein CERZMDRAFT_90063 [Cercospora zeae-maydis SCOH1-5]|uniref:Uncharacterized protein n=1 Tax=Cercospora zeae-maydis SCOH1-5 TaxID=717836 RepID=A0A6A6FRM0_9PEZI|nr:hypothetical protein CERZMDRAFT_90063 [Cercospora zeae-maydis SCOH1-5]
MFPCIKRKKKSTRELLPIIRQTKKSPTQSIETRTPPLLRPRPLSNATVPLHSDVQTWQPTPENRPFIDALSQGLLQTYILFPSRFFGSQNSTLAHKVNRR